MKNHIENEKETSNTTRKLQEIECKHVKSKPYAYQYVFVLYQNKQVSKKQYSSSHFTIKKMKICTYAKYPLEQLIFHFFVLTNVRVIFHYELFFIFVCNSSLKAPMNDISFKKT